MQINLWEIGRLVGFKMPEVRKRAKCPFRDHKRHDKTFTVYKARTSGDALWKCHSCDAPNSGDAISFYAKHQGLDRNTALEQLRERGYDVPDADRRQEHEAPRPRRRDSVVPIEGVKIPQVMPLNMDDWRRWRSNGQQLVKKFAEARHLRADVLKSLDVLQVDDRCVGFGYRHPETLVPCRVKVRAVDKKAFWVQPKGEGEAVPLAPLYLAHLLRFSKYVFITEGEVDALTIKCMGVHNVVSLPDGASSASTVDLQPISNHGIWFLSLDDDEAGHAAAAALRRRAWQVGAQPVPIYWHLDGYGKWKDINEAVQQDMNDDVFRECIGRACDAAIGYRIEL